MSQKDSKTDLDQSRERVQTLIDRIWVGLPQETKPTPEEWRERLAKVIRDSEERTRQMEMLTLNLSEEEPTIPSPESSD